MIEMFMGRSSEDLLTKVDSLENLALKMKGTIDQNKNGKIDWGDLGVMAIKGLIAFFIIVGFYLALNYDGLELIFTLNTSSLSEAMKEVRTNELRYFLTFYISVFSIFILDARGKKKLEKKEGETFFLTVENKLLEKKVKATDIVLIEEREENKRRLQLKEHQLFLAEIMNKAKDVSYLSLQKDIDGLYDYFIHNVDKSAEELRENYKLFQLTNEEIEKNKSISAEIDPAIIEKEI